MYKIFTLKDSSMQQRDSFIDYLRGAAMILVLLHHSGFPLGQFILAFHMPLFFVLSGYLGNISGGYKRPFKQYIWKKFTRLIIPYFTFEILNLVIWCIKCLIEHNNLPGFESLFSIITCINNDYQGLYGRLWFLPCMFIADIYIWFIINHIKSERFTHILSIIILFSLSLVTTRIIPFRLPFTMDTALFATAFIMLGYCFSDVIKVLLNNENNICKILLAISCLGYLLYSVRYAGAKVWMFLNIYGEYTVSICAAICGCIAFFIISSYIYIIIIKLKILNNLLLWYGRNSLATFPVHLTIKMFLIWYAPRFLIGWYFMFIIILILNIPIVNAITNYLPFMLGHKYNIPNKTS